GAPRGPDRADALLCRIVVERPGGLAVASRGSPTGNQLRASVRPSCLPDARDLEPATRSALAHRARWGPPSPRRRARLGARARPRLAARPLARLERSPGGGPCARGGPDRR